MKLVYTAGVLTGVHVVASCVKTGIIFKMRKRYFFMYGHQTFTAPVHPFINNISEGDIKGLFFNITKFSNLLVQLSIFLIVLFVGTYRLSSHARLEAFVIQTKLNIG